jgi:hypothetical protein
MLSQRLPGAPDGKLVKILTRRNRIPYVFNGVNLQCNIYRTIVTPNTMAYHRINKTGAIIDPEYAENPVKL